MYVVVLVLGILAIVLGTLATAYGVTIKEFNFGNSLLIVGATAFVGGLVLIGIAGAIRELHRIVQALNGRQVPRYQRPVEPYEPIPATPRPGLAPARMPAPPMPPMPQSVPPRGRDVGALGPRLETVEPAEAKSAEPPAPVSEPEVASAAEPEQLSLLPSEAPPVAPSGGGEPPTVVEEFDAIPLSPREPDDGRQAHLFDHGEMPAADHAAESEPEAKAAVDDRIDEPPQAVPPAAERGSAFDAIWPRRARAARNTVDEAAAAREPEPPAPSAQSSDDSISISPEPMPSHAEPQPAAHEPRAPHPISILKSGVVDGMAYTLYSDGSIEAELASGTIRFASIQELRAHLERTS